MNTLALVLSILNAITGLIGRGAVAIDQVQQLLDYVTTLAGVGEDAHAELQRLRLQIQSVAKTGGPVPAAMWEEWGQRHQQAHDRLQALKDADGNG
jgi:hypothetical protein